VKYIIITLTLYIIIIMITSALTRCNQIKYNYNIIIAGLSFIRSDVAYNIICYSGKPPTTIRDLYLLHTVKYIDHRARRVNRACVIIYLAHCWFNLINVRLYNVVCSNLFANHSRPVQMPLNILRPMRSIG
jgi:hypothetical protein